MKNTRQNAAFLQNALKPRRRLMTQYAPQITASPPPAYMLVHFDAAPKPKLTPHSARYALARREGISRTNSSMKRYISSMKNTL